MAENNRFKVAVENRAVSQDKLCESINKLQEQLDSLKKEFAFLSQQNLSMFTATTNCVRKSTEALMEGMKNLPAQLRAEVVIDYDVLAQKVADIITDSERHLLMEVDAEELSSKLAEKMDLPPVEVDFGTLARDIAGNLQMPPLELDYGSLATDIARKIRLPESKATEERLDYAKIAEYILEALPEVDYKSMAENLAEELSCGEEEVQSYIAEHRPTVGTAVITEEVEEFPIQELVEEPGAESEKQPVGTFVLELDAGETELPVEELVEETAEEVAQAAGVQPQEEQVLVATDSEADENGTRLKRSYECKLRQSSDELKQYVGNIKNTLLSYEKVKSNVSWNCDRFNYGRATVAKMNIIGKTLCLYLALNPDDYSTTKYHQKSVGDVKAYESTPMMVKVKSNMAVKRASALVTEMMDSLGAKRQEIEPVDYVSVYEYKTDEEMIEAGEIKKANTKEKKDLSSL